MFHYAKGIKLNNKIMEIKNLSNLFFSFIYFVQQNILSLWKWKCLLRTLK